MVPLVGDAVRLSNNSWPRRVWHRSMVSCGDLALQIQLTATGTEVSKRSLMYRFFCSLRLRAEFRWRARRA